MPKTVGVAVSNATFHFDKLYTYAVLPEHQNVVRLGSMVLVPFGKGSRARMGVVLACDAEPEHSKLKYLFDVAPASACLTPELLRLVYFLKERTFCTYYEAVKAVIPYGAQYKPAVAADGVTPVLQKQLTRHTENAYKLVGTLPQKPKPTAKQLAAVALLLKRNFRISRRDFGVLAGLSLMYAATSLGLLRSYDYIPSGVATTVNFLYPLVVTIVMTLFFRERSSVWIVIAVFISLVGVALLAWGDAGNNDPGRGLIYAGTTVFTYAVYIIGVMKSRAGRLDPLIVAFYVLTFSAAVFLVYALSTSGIAVVHTWHIWRNLLLLALLPTVLSNLTLVLAIKHIGSTMTSILGSMEPLTAVLVGVVHFGERFDLDSAAGLILVVTAVIIVILQTNHTPQTPPANIPPTQPQE